MLNVDGDKFSFSIIDFCVCWRKSSSAMSRKSLGVRLAYEMLFFQRFFSTSAIVVGGVFLMNLQSDFMALAERGALDLIARSISHFWSSSSFCLGAAGSFGNYFCCSLAFRSFSFLSFSACYSASIFLRRAFSSCSFCLKSRAPANNASRAFLTVSGSCS